MHAHIRNGLLFIGVCVAAGLALAIMTFPKGTEAEVSPQAIDAGPEESSLGSSLSTASGDSNSADAPRPEQDQSEETYQEPATAPLAPRLTPSDRETLENGEMVMVLAGRVVNPTDEDQPVPPIFARLESAEGETVYSWQIEPPARVLRAGTSVSFESTEIGIPSGGDRLTVTFGGRRT